MQPERDVALELITEIIKRRDKGLAVYGKPVDPNSLSLREWLVHLKEELGDAHLYSIAAIDRVLDLEEELRDVKRQLEEARSQEEYWRRLAVDAEDR